MPHPLAINPKPVNPTRGIPGGPVYLAQTSFLLLLLFSF